MNLLLSITTFFLMLPVQSREIKLASARISVDGYTCSMCGLSVEMALQTLPFVHSVTSDLESTSVRLTFKPGMKVRPDLIGEKVKGAGFSVASMTYYFEGKISPSDATLKVSDFSYGVCGVESGVDSARVVGKNLQSKKEFKLLSQKNTCIGPEYSYWLLAY